MKYGATLFFVSLVFSFALLSPSVKKKTLTFFTKESREVLSQLDYRSEENRYKIIKIKGPKGLLVEVYRYTDDGMMLVDTKELSDKKDAYYRFGTQKHNLFIKDINADGSDEIILPSIDKNMKARLNVFIFDSNLEQLQKVTKH